MSCIIMKVLTLRAPSKTHQEYVPLAISYFFCIFCVFLPFTPLFMDINLLCASQPVFDELQRDAKVVISDSSFSTYQFRVG